MNNHPGPLIRQIRIAKGMSTYELERVTGLRRCNLSRYERCLQYSIRCLDPLYAITKALGTSVPALFVMQEICQNDPFILNNQCSLLQNLNRVHSILETINKPHKRAA